MQLELLSDRDHLDQRLDKWLATEQGRIVRAYVTLAALREVDKGAKKLSIKWIIENARRDPCIPDDLKKQYKIDNSLVSRLSRHIEENNPSLRGVFTKKALKK